MTRHRSAPMPPSGPVCTRCRRQQGSTDRFANGPACSHNRQRHRPVARVVTLATPAGAAPAPAATPRLSVPVRIGQCRFGCLDRALARPLGGGLDPPHPSRPAIAPPMWRMAKVTAVRTPCLNVAVRDEPSQPTQSPHVNPALHPVRTRCGHCLCVAARRARACRI